MLVPTELERKMYEYVCEIQRKQTLAVRNYGSSGAAPHESFTARQALIDEYQDRYVHQVYWRAENAVYHTATYKEKIIGTVFIAPGRNYIYTWITKNKGIGQGRASDLDLAKRCVETYGKEGCSEG